MMPVGLIGRYIAFYLRSFRNIALTKIHFKYLLGLYSLEKEHKIAKINLGSRQWPCFDTTRFQVPSADEALCIACANPGEKEIPEKNPSN